MALPTVLPKAKHTATVCSFFNISFVSVYEYKLAYWYLLLLECIHTYTHVHCSHFFLGYISSWLRRYWV